MIDRILPARPEKGREEKSREGKKREGYDTIGGERGFDYDSRKRGEDGLGIRWRN